jgi:uncharacterized protein involved in outer membrane biogenesis
LRASFGNSRVRVIARICAALLALFFVAAIVLYVVVPRFVGEDVVRVRLSDATRSAIGRGIEFTTLKFEWFPPAVIGIGAVVGDEAMPLARAERIKLTPALASLLAGVLLIDSATVEGATIRLVRNRSQIAFADAGSVETNEAVAINRDARPDLALRGVSLSGAVITLEDRTVDPALVWMLRGVDASAFAEAVGSPIRIDLAGEIAPAGRLAGDGVVALDGELELEFEFESVAIATARPYFAADGDVGGLLTGSIRVSGNIESPAIELTATLREANLQLGEIALRGNLEVDASIRNVLDAPKGLVELDATEAELGYAGFFTKAPGTPARVVGKVTTGGGGSLAIDVWEFVMRDLDGQVRVGADNRFPLAHRRPELGVGLWKSAQ